MNLLLMEFVQKAGLRMISLEKGSTQQGNKELFLVAYNLCCFEMAGFSLGLLSL